MLKTIKRKIALVAVAGLGAGLVSVAPASAVTETLTGTVSPMRVSFVGTVADSVPAGVLSFTTTAALGDAGTSAVLTVTSAPNSAVKLNVSQQVDGSDFDDLATGAGAVAAGDVLAGDTVAGLVKLPIYIDKATAAAGTYTGTLVITDATVGNTDAVTVNFSFTTVGAPASYTLTQTSTSTLLQGIDTATLTLLDGAGKTTQPGSFDSFALTTTAGTFTDAAGDVNGTVSATELATGVASLTFTAANAASTTTVTATPGGVLPGQGFAAKTLTYTVTGTILATALTAMTVTAPTTAVLVANVTAGASNTASIPAGTSAVTVGFTGTASSKYRFKLSGAAGTINGAAATTAQFVNVDTDALGKGSIALTLGGSALVEGVATTVEQVTVANAAATNNVDIVITQNIPNAAAGTVTLSPTGNIIAKLGVTTPVTVTVADQFGTAIGAGWTVRAFRGTPGNTTLLSSGVTSAAGTVTLNVSQASTLVAAGAETYNFTATLGATTFTATAQVIVNYTTDGAITGMTTTVENAANAAMGTTSLAAAAGTGVGATVATTQSVYPAIEIPSDGTASDDAFDGIYTVSTAAVTTAAAAAYDRANGGELVTLATTTTPANSVVYTVSEGLFLCATNSCDWAAGLKTATVASGADVFVFGTKTGIGTVTATSGGLTREIKVFVKNDVADSYSVAATPATATVAGGAYGVITVSVKDAFGNGVDTGATDVAVVADGAVLLGGMAASTTTGTGAAGTGTVTYIGNNTGGTGTVVVSNAIATPTAWVTGYTKKTGFPDVVKSATVTLTVTAASVTTDPLKADVATANAAVKALATQVTVLQASVATLIDSLTTQIASLMKSVSALTKAVAKLQAKK